MNESHFSLIGKPEMKLLIVCGYYIIVVAMALISLTLAIKVVEEDTANKQNGKLWRKTYSIDWVANVKGMCILMSILFSQRIVKLSPSFSCKVSNLECTSIVRLS